MGKITIEFDIDEEERSIDDALNGWRWRSTLHDLDQELRQTTKNGLFKSRVCTDDEIRICEHFRGLIRDFMADNGLVGKDLV
jgi:hypothetical protein